LASSAPSAEMGLGSKMIQNVIGGKKGDDRPSILIPNIQIFKAWPHSRLVKSRTKAYVASMTPTLDA